MRALSFLTLLWWSAAAAAADTNASPRALRVALPGLQGVNLPPEALGFYTEHLGQNLRSPMLSVVTARDISTLLGLERQRQLMGCADSNCFAELANALGADAIVVGDVARFGETFQVNIKVLAPGDASVLAARSARVEGEVAALDALATTARELGVALLTRKGISRAPGIDGWTLVPLSVGVVAGVGGAVALGLARADYDALRARGTSLQESEALALRDGGATKQALGVVGLAVGAAGLAAAGAVMLFGKRALAVAVVPSADGAVFAFTGSLP